jgi:hypothetical protein
MSGSDTMPWQPTVILAVPLLARASSPSSDPPSCAEPPHVPPCLGSFHRCTMWVHLRATLHHSRHSLDSIAEMVATAASAIVTPHDPGLRLLFSDGTFPP